MYGGKIKKEGCEKLGAGYIRRYKITCELLCLTQERGGNR